MIGWVPSSHDEKVASVRYRTMWPLASLRHRGHPVSLFQPGAKHLYSSLIFNKRANLEDLYLAQQCKRRGGSVIFDLCDNHFYNPRGLPEYSALRTRLLAMIETADLVICPVETLAEIVAQEARAGTEIVVVGDFVERVAVPDAAPNKSQLPTLLWYGSHGSDNAESGMLDLLKVSADLQRQYQRAPFELLVVSNNRDKFDTYIAELPLPTRYEEWNSAAFPALLSTAAAVLLPLSPNPFVACKSHIRMTLSLWAGIPVVADTIRSYAEFAPFSYLDCWPDGLAAVVERPVEAKARAGRARQYIKAAWSPAKVVNAWEKALTPFLAA